MRSLGQGPQDPQGAHEAQPGQRTSRVQRGPNAPRPSQPQAAKPLPASSQALKAQARQQARQQAHQQAQPQAAQQASQPQAPRVAHAPDHPGTHNRTQEGRALFSGGIARQGLVATRPDAGGHPPNRKAAKLAAKAGAKANARAAKANARAAKADARAAKVARKAAKSAKAARPGSAAKGQAPRLIRGHGQPRRDPAPSRLTYKFHRLWLTPLYRSLLRVGVPVFLVISMTGWYFSNPTNRFAIVEKAENIRRSVETRPEFMVKLMAVEGASAVLDTAIREIIPITFPISSFDLDLDEMQAEVASLDVVKAVTMRVRPGGVLEINVTERDPVLVWRAPTGIELIDDSGHRVASLTDRAARPDLPLVAGAGADAHVPEALSLLATARPLADRLRGLVRVGERRWDVVLSSGGTILLPEKNPLGALEQVLAIDQAQELLDRDLTHIDMRNPLRPTLRMAAPAVEELRRIRTLSSE